MHILENLLAYLPQDRRQALAVGRELPRQIRGAALCADLSGFTPLTETLARKLGKRRGAEELALQLNRFYEALIAPVEAYDGSVIDFSGDAINCWFEADDGQRAVAAAQAMQTAMQPFASLQLPTGDTVSVGVKIAVASGHARRFLVGDPAIQTWDTLAGSIMDRLAVLGHLAGTGEVLADETTAAQLEQWLQIRAWRVETGQRAAMIGGLAAPIQVETTPKAALSDLSEEQVRPWLLPAVFARLQGGQGEFLTELRPAVALFLRFDGLDYDGDKRAGDKLDEFIRQVQHILVEYEGTLLQLTLGDKGSYLYAAFGAPVAHENDVERAITAALALCLLPIQLESIHSVSIGLSRGTMRTGAYGSAVRRTYGVLGDEVNLAARLMQRAAPGQILASETVWQAASDFDWQMQPVFEAKGKRVPITPAALLGRRELGSFEMRTGLSALPIVGRQAELALIEEKLELARQGQGQIVSITGEAGMGKSRLLTEVLQRRDNLTQYGGECQSYGTQSAYLVWHSIWRTFFGLDPSDSSVEQTETLETALAEINPNFPLRLPLLGVALNLSIPDNGLTSAMDAKARKTSRESLLIDCIRARAGGESLVFVLEDLHWIDPLSRDLLEGIGRAIKDLPILILLAYRPPVEAEVATFLPGIASLEYATEVPLVELTRAETEQLVAARLAHFGLEGDPSTGSGQAVSPLLLERLSARAQGNPFYIEELLNYLHDRGLDPRLEASWEQADLPNSLHSLILSRIDRLAERQQITIKTASVIGRLFQAAWLYGYYPSLGGPAQVSADLEALRRLEFTLLETPEPRLAYLFKHVITQEAAYESLAYATRATLHEQFANYLELAAGENVGPYLDLLAYHYERSENLPKKRLYLRRAGEAAAAAFANEAALSYLGRALALAPESDYIEWFDILLEREKIHAITGRSEAHDQDLKVLAALAENLDDNRRRAQVGVSRIRYFQNIGDFPAAIAVAKQAVAFARLVDAEEDEARAYWLWGDALGSQGNHTDARDQYEQALALAQSANLAALVANSLMALGYLDIIVANYNSAQNYLERALHLQSQAGNRLGETIVIYYLGESAYRQGDFAQAQIYYEQALLAWRSLGHKANEGMILTRLGNLIFEQRGDYAKARLYCEQAFRLAQESRGRVGEVNSLYCLSLIDLAQNYYLAARIHAEQALHICREIGYQYYEGGCFAQLGSIADEVGEYVSSSEYHQEGLSIFREMSEQDAICQFLTVLGMGYYHWGRYEKALENSQQALSIAQETKNNLVQNRALTLQGHVFRETGNLDDAAKVYWQALVLAQEFSLPDYCAKSAQTGLACMALMRGDLDEAQAPLGEILDYLETSSLSTMDEAAWIYLSCYRILQANNDPRAQSTLQAAYNFIQEIAARIDDERLRASFLQNVRANREIIAAWEGLTAQ